MKGYRAAEGEMHLHWLSRWKIIERWLKLPITERYSRRKRRNDALKLKITIEIWKCFGQNKLPFLDIIIECTCTEAEACSAFLTFLFTKMISFLCPFKLSHNTARILQEEEIWIFNDAFALLQKLEDLI
jgi:hypothetical protein